MIPYLSEYNDKIPENDDDTPEKLIPEVHPETPDDSDNDNDERSSDDDIPEEFANISPNRIISANISEVTKNLRDVAIARADERLRTEQSQANIFKKIGRLYTRAKLRERYIREEMARLQTSNIFDEQTRHIRENAADRFEKANSLFENNEIITENTIEDPRINALALRYVRGEIDEKIFEEEFNDLLDEE